MPRPVKEDSNEDTELENAIGEVFGQFDLAQLNNQSLEPSENHPEQEYHHNHPSQQHSSSHHILTQEPHSGSGDFGNHQQQGPEGFDGRNIPDESVTDAHTSVNTGADSENLTHVNHNYDNKKSHEESSQDHPDDHHDNEASGVGETDADINFEAAIHDAFQSLQDSQNIHHQDIRDHPNEIPSNDRQKSNNESSALEMLDHPEPVQEELDVPNSHHDADSSESSNDHDHHDSHHQGGDDIDLANAITDAIQSIDPEGMNHEESPHHHINKDDSSKKDGDKHDHIPAGHSQPQGDHQHQLDSSVHYSPLQMEKDDDNDENDDDEDLNLQNAIGSAFESLKDKQDDLNDDGLNKVITESFQNLVTNEKSGPQNKSKIDMNDLVSNIVSQINDDNRSNSISEDILQELAQEITSQVQFQEDSDLTISKRRNLNVAGLPKIDDNILNHFVNEANKEHRKLSDQGAEEDQRGSQHQLDNRQVQISNKHQNNRTVEPANEAGINERLQSTMANVVKNVISGEHDKEPELNNLEMNEILTNAFNMAMENPTELLNNLETDELKLDRFKGKDSNQRRLSIAETLALHRSKEKGGDKEGDEKYLVEKAKEAISAKEKLEQDKVSSLRSELGPIPSNEKRTPTTTFDRSSNLHNDLSPVVSDTSIAEKSVDINSQLSSVISNISNRALPTSNFGNNNDRNLVSIIKSMTSFLTNSNFQVFKSSRSLISVINNYKSNNYEALFINSLNLAKSYLSSQELEKSVAPIDNVLILYGKHSTADDLDYSHSLISLVSTTVLNVISNFSSLRSFKNLYSRKLKLSPMEYKERVRIENRERKKRWRVENSERNKDNDLRGRVTKKANNIFGDSDSKEKTAWIEEEFNKRKQRRLARQREGEEKGSHDELDRHYDEYVNDKQLIDIITDYFNVFSNFAPKDDPETGLKTTSTTIATVAIIYLLVMNPDLDSKRIDGIVNSLMTDLVNTFTSLEQQERLIYLAKGSNNSKLEHLEPLQLENEDNTSDKAIDGEKIEESRTVTDPELTGISYPPSVSGDSLSSNNDIPQKRQIQNIHQKDEGNQHGNQPEFQSEMKSKSDAIFTRITSTLKDYDLPNKRLKLSEDGNISREHPHPISGGGSLNDLTPLSNIRLPPYKQRFPDTKKDYNSIIAKKEATLKKPGAFQRPAYSKSDKKSKSFGFPSFHSTSIRH